MRSHPRPAAAGLPGAAFVDRSAVDGSTPCDGARDLPFTLAGRETRT